MKLTKLIYICITILCTSCVGKNSSMSEYFSIIRSSRPFFEPTPYGMTYVPRGSFTLGAADEVSEEILNQKRVTIEAFWIDETEITNDEYRQYVFWVRDSLFRKRLAEENPKFLVTENKKTKQPLETPYLDWDTEINWKDQEVKEALEEFYLEQDGSLFSKSLDVHRLSYTYEWVDYHQAAKRQNSYNFDTQSYTGTVTNINGDEEAIENRNSFVFRETTPVYPDTLVWIRDFTYSYNEPRTRTYFWHKSFDNYPVVGISWKQAVAFCKWRTMLYDKRQNESKLHSVFDYRLPTEAEWEYAARGNKSRTLYPWGSYYANTDMGCYIANFKPRRGNYVADNNDGATTVKVATYKPNDLNIYDMAGNVAEWTSSAFNESAYEFIADFNPNFEYNAKPDDHPVLKRKVVRGGSWKDISYFMRNGTRSYEYQDTVKSYIGFRCVKTSFMDEFKEQNIKKN